MGSSFIQIFLMFNVLGIYTCILVEYNDHQDLLLMKQQMQTLQTQVNSLTSKVQVLEKDAGGNSIAFMAELGTTIDNPAADRQLVFDVVHLNRGNAYNNLHGSFIAPVNGTYHFSLELSFPATTTTAYKLTHVNIKKGSQVLGYIYGDGIQKTWIKRSATALVDLNVGDDVYTVVTSVSGTQKIAGGGMHSMFSGFLVREI